MNCFNLKAAVLCLLITSAAAAQIPKRSINAMRITRSLKIDGVLDEPEWKTAPVADKFVELRPVLNRAEDTVHNATLVYFLYNNEGIYIGGYCHERSKDSISSELTGRDGFGNNDFIGIIFDTYNDKINGFEYFVTPLGEQFDAKQAPNPNGNSEDFGWNAVWYSASKIHDDGWSFEMFLPYSAIRFGNKKIQDWGLNIVRRRQKTGQQSFWQTIDPTANGFLTQEGFLKGLQDIKPPLRLQFSPYFATYLNHDGTLADHKTTTPISAGLDVKYGINQAFTLDMMLVPDFGQVQSDSRVLNLTPFEQQYKDNRAFFTEGTELFNKGGLFYSRRIGGEPLHRDDFSVGANEQIEKNPAQTKLYNATKISGRTQKGLGIGFLNAIAQPSYAVVEDVNSKESRRVQTSPLTNYNVMVFDQTLKHNSSVTLVNTNVMREGKEYDANVTAFLFDLNDRKNKYNIGGNFNVSNKLEAKTTTGVNYGLYLGKTSGRFNVNLWHSCSDDKYNNSDLGYFTNNNERETGLWMGYSWNKPTKYFNSVFINTNGHYFTLVSPLDIVKGRDRMFERFRFNFNFNFNLKNLWYVYFNVNGTTNNNDFYEPRATGRVFHNKGNVGLIGQWQSNQAKKLSWGGNIIWGEGAVTNRKTFLFGLSAKYRMNNYFSVEASCSPETDTDQPGYAATLSASTPSQMDTIIFSRRDLHIVENMLNFKYNFNTKMGLTLRLRHYWSKVDPKQFYQLNLNGDLVNPDHPYTGNVNQNYNYLTADFVYTWQFAQGSFFNVVWKNIGETFTDQFEKDYFTNFTKTGSGPQYNSFSLKVIYFLDYLTEKNRLKKKHEAGKG
ncbi:MAG: carbohydrate binding family 9 domain-containing protein [Bacteroidetes bacterium]|nr:carbohydrate binding family 9 domain-containing protein [Bacteroidota bacterium]